MQSPIHSESSRTAESHAVILYWSDQDCIQHQRTLRFKPGLEWIDIGASSDCDLVVTETNFPQLGFQVNWRPPRAPFLYAHPSIVLCGETFLEATLINSTFPLVEWLAVRVNQTQTLFIIAKESASLTSGAIEEIFERLRETTSSDQASRLRLGCSLSK